MVAYEWALLCYLGILRVVEERRSADYLRKVFEISANLPKFKKKKSVDRNINIFTSTFLLGKTYNASRCLRIKKVSALQC